MVWYGEEGGTNWVFQRSWAAFTFFIAVSRVKGGFSDAIVSAFGINKSYFYV